MDEVVFHDNGKLLFAFTMLWAYFNFSQWLIIWAGNLPEEIGWFLRAFAVVGDAVACFWWSSTLRFRFDSAVTEA